MVGRRTRTAVLVVILLMIVISAMMLYIRYPSKFEIIYGGIGAIMAAIALYLSMHSLDVAESAQKDSSRSADATEESTVIARQAREDSKLSAEVARDALQLALAEQAIARERYRSERGPRLRIHKQEAHIPFMSPFSGQPARYAKDLASKWDYSTFFLSNDGAGAATTIDMSWHMINAHEYDDFRFFTDEINPSITAFDIASYPIYGLELKLEMDVSTNEVSEALNFQITRQGTIQRKDQRKPKVQKSRTKSKLPLRIGTLKNGEEFPFKAPWIFQVLAHHFFLERVIVMSEDKQLDEDAAKEIERWKTPNPRLRVRFQYIDTVLEHMNDFKEATRVKEFEITCSEVVRLVPTPISGKPMYYPKNSMNSHFNIQMIYDRQLSEIQAEEASIEGEETDGSTRPMEG